MLVVPFAVFEAQGRIHKSTAAWRGRAEREGMLVRFDPARHVAIFVSHTWWDRDFQDESNDPNDPYDKGAPDYQSGEKKDLKHRIIVEGVKRLIASRGLAAESVCIWIDWTCIYQDDRPMKLKGVKSLIKDATDCKFMLIPTEEERVTVGYPEKIKTYGKRGWCRAEFFIFALWSAIVGREGEVELYAAARDGALKRFSKVEFNETNDLPEQGALSVEKDREAVKKLQDDMISAFGHCVIRQKCESLPKEVKLGAIVHLGAKMLRDEHMPTLCDFIAGGLLTNLEVLKLNQNSIRNAGMASLSEALSKGTLASLKKLDLTANKIGDAGMRSLSQALATGAILPELEALLLSVNKIGNAGMVSLSEAIGKGHLPSLMQLTATGNTGNAVPLKEVCSARGIKLQANFD